MSLHAISPVDGRYADKTAPLSEYFSEYALIRQRIKIEVEYLIALSELPEDRIPRFTADAVAQLRDIYTKFTGDDALRVKEIESKTNHDVKAAEYFMKEKMEVPGLGAHKEWVHFALTSQDVNNTAIPILIRDAVGDCLTPALDAVREKLSALATEWRDAAMIAHTHGQPASPTTMGKEIRVFAERLAMQSDILGTMRYYGKFGGATGNFNAHKAALPAIDWPAFADKFVASLGLIREQTTTQIDHYDHLAALFHLWIRVNSILIDLCLDIWSYIAMQYITQKAVAGETGSSAMPHKVNPIDFENAEGNLMYANAIFGFLAEKLPVSRLQRDLTDSTVLRNVGVPFAHTLIALLAIRKGLDKIALNRDKLAFDLGQNWQILAEAIQTILRREGVERPYELLKDLTRGNDVLTKEQLWEFIDALPVTSAVKEELRALTPAGYIGYAG